MYKNWIRGLRRRTSGQVTAKSGSITTLVVNPAVAYQKQSNLSREICGTSRTRDWGEVIRPDPAAEVSSGHITHTSEEGPNRKRE